MGPQAPSYLEGVPLVGEGGGGVMPRGSYVEVLPKRLLCGAPRSRGGYA